MDQKEIIFFTSDMHVGAIYKKERWCTTSCLSLSLVAYSISTPFLFFSSVSLKGSGVHIWLRAQQLPDEGGGSAARERPQFGSPHSCGYSDFNRFWDSSSSYMQSISGKTSLTEANLCESKHTNAHQLRAFGGCDPVSFALLEYKCHLYSSREACVRKFHYCYSTSTL